MQPTVRKAVSPLRSATAIQDFVKTLPDHDSDDRADDRSGHEIREPMDGHGDTQADIAGVEDRHPTQPPLFRTEREHCHGHSEGDGGVRRRPAPENSTAQPAEAEDMTDVLADTVRRMNATRNCLVNGSDKRAEEFSLTNSPTGQNGSGTLDNEADDKQEQWQGERQQRTNSDGGPHPRTKRRIAGGQKPAPVEAGQDENESEQDGNDMPNDPPAREAANEVAGHRHQKLFHAEMV